MGFWDLAFLVPKYNPISEIPKTMIFLNKIEDIIEIKRYLQSRLLDCICNKNQASVVISSITFNLNANTRIKVIENLRYSNAWICIYIEYASIGINIPDIIHMIQFKILNFYILLELLQ